MKAALRRFVVAIATLLAVSALVFFGVEAFPGNAATAALGQQATPQRVEALEERYGLDEPVVKRYFDWLGGLLHGDLGESPASGRSVSSILGENVRNTAILAGCVILLLVPLAIGLGILSALWHDRAFDSGVAVTTLTFISTPEFVMGSLLIVLFSSWLAILPASSIIDPSTSVLSQWKLLVLPVLTLTLVSAAQAIRMIRAAMIEVLHSDYVQAATLRGVPRRRLILRHALPNALDSTIQIIALTVGYLVGGVVVTETLFQYPGVGTAITHAVAGQDIPTVVAASMLVTAVYVIANLLADLTTIALNPKLRRGHG
ncbi:MAG: ABC transporter permease [Actinobacteria bacterium]|nr:ABC transporter permease [Actinomycetota bacterium]